METDELDLISPPDDMRLVAVDPGESAVGEKGAQDRPFKPRLASSRKQSNNINGANKMDVMKMLGELKQEREHIEEAILTLERLARGRGKRRGRPPSWMKEVKRRGRPPGSKNKSKESSVA
jgi:hypothetical protein